mgnify:CR=1 FL=1
MSFTELPDLWWLGIYPIAIILSIRDCTILCKPMHAKHALLGGFCMWRKYLQFFLITFVLTNACHRYRESSAYDDAHAYMYGGASLSVPRFGAILRNSKRCRTLSETHFVPNVHILAKNHITLSEAER